MGVSVSLKEIYQASTLVKMAMLVSSEKDQQQPEELTDWDRETETAIPGSMLVHKRLSQHRKDTNDHDREVLLTGATSFLSSAILSSLLEGSSISKAHWVAIPAE